MTDRIDLGELAGDERADEETPASERNTTGYVLAVAVPLFLVATVRSLLT